MHGHDSENIAMYREWFVVGYKDRDEAIFIGSTVRRKEFDSKFKGNIARSAIYDSAFKCYSAGWDLCEAPYQGSDGPIKAVKSSFPDNELVPGLQRIKTRLIGYKSGVFLTGATRKECIAEFNYLLRMTKDKYDPATTADMSEWFEHGFINSDSNSLSNNMRSEFDKLFVSLITGPIIGEELTKLSLQVSNKYTSDAFSWFRRGWNYFGDYYNRPKIIPKSSKEMYLRTVLQALLSEKPLMENKANGWTLVSGSFMGITRRIILKPLSFKLKE
jgi:hypothetical protein